MLWSSLLLLPLALARPHLPAHRRHVYANANAKLVERAGAAYDNETQAEISAWNHDHESVSATVAVSSSVSTASAIEAVGTALTAVNTPSSSAVSSSVQPAETQAEQSAAASPSTVEQPVSSQEAQPEQSSAAEVDAAAPSSSSDAPSSSPTSIARSVLTTVVTASRSSTVVRITASASASATAAAAASEPEKIAGINKTTFIIIIVVAAVVALVGAGWTVFRKWKLSPSRKFDEKMRPIDFSPHQDVFMEKSHHRSASNSSAAMQRQEFVAELDSKHVEGVPDHDFTAGSNMAGQGIYDNYHQDPYASAEAYEYDAAYQYDDAGRGGYEQPTQDTGAGYTDLQRGNSIGSGSGHGHGHAVQYPVEQYPVEQFPMPDHYLARPGSGEAYPQSAHRY